MRSGALIRTLRGAAAVGLLAAGGVASASLVVGNEAIDRTGADGWSNFVVGLETEVFSQPGTITDWEVWAHNPGDFAMLLLRNAGGNNWTVVGSDHETVATAGLHQFSWNPESGNGQAMVDDILGLYIGSARIDFDRSDANDYVRWCGSNGCINNSSQYAAGSTLSLTGGGPNNSNGTRTYSANVTAVPEPAGLGLAGLALLLGAFARRR